MQAHDQEAVASLCPVAGVLGALRELRQIIEDPTCTDQIEANAYMHAACLLMRHDGAWSGEDQRRWVQERWRERAGREIQREVRRDPSPLPARYSSGMASPPAF